jgi:hypothetical protein
MLYPLSYSRFNILVLLALMLMPNQISELSFNSTLRISAYVAHSLERRKRIRWGEALTKLDRLLAG